MPDDARQVALPDVMRAAAVDKFGPPSALTVHKLPVPEPSPREVLIALEWAGVGSWDASIRDGSWPVSGKKRFPLVPGVDGAGIVVATGARVRRFRVGDRVYAYESGNPKGGCYAQFVAVKAEHVDHGPRAVSTRDGAACVTTALTAMLGINLLRLRPGSTVLVFGASGAVGTMAVQIAKRRAAIVIATASGRAASRIVKQLGADFVVDARKDSAVAHIVRHAPHGVDALLAQAGGDELERILALQPRAIRVVHPNGVEPVPKRRKGVTVRGYDAFADWRQFAALGKYVGDGSIEVPVTAVYPLSQAARAHRRLARGHVIGRMLLRVPQSTVTPA